MINAGIHDRDVVVVDRAKKPASGQIVLACLAGEFTIKRFVCHDDGRVSLLPENPNYRPIHLGDAEELEVWAVCMFVLHPLCGLLP